MEATEVVNPNGNIERTIVLDPEESEAVLNQIVPNLADQVRVQIEQESSTSPNIPITAEELERLCDEAVGITTTQTMDNIYPPDNVGVASAEILREYSDFEEVEDITETQEEPSDADNGLEESLRSLNETIDEMGGSEATIAEDFHERVEEAIHSEEPIAPVVYNTQLNSVTTTRFSGAEWFNKIHEQNIIVGGAGGISSWLALLLARTNAGEITIYDNDKVEAVNLAGQFFGVHDVGHHKVCAVYNHVREFADYYMLHYYNRRYDDCCNTSRVMMCGFDNMEARKLFFNKWKSYLRANFDPSNFLFIDGRLSAECLQVLCVQGDDAQAIKTYEEQYLFSDEMADTTVCSYKQTSFMSNMIAATMVNIFVNWCANQAGSFRPVPFFTEYDAVTMQYKLKMNAV